MIRLVASDLDGTLLEHNGQLPADTFDAIQMLNDNGICFAASSGRQYGNLVRLFAPAAQNMAFVCENGAFCVAQGKEVGTTPIPNDITMAIIADLQALNLNLLISGKYTCYMLDENRKYTDDIVYRLRNTVTMISSVADIAEPILKISCQTDDGVAQLAPALIEKWGNVVTATISGRDWFDFTVANKGIGMETLMHAMNIKKEEVAAFGDNFNDETMLDLVGYPFLMKTAHPDLHKQTYHLCDKVVPMLREIANAKGDMERVLKKING